MFNKSMSNKIGFLKQVYILLWKNGILFRRNYVGSIFQILLSIVFIGVLIIVRYYVDKTNYPDEQPEVTNVFDRMLLSTRRNRIYYYPNNQFIRDIVINAVSFIQLYRPLFTPRIIGFDSSNCSSLDSTAIFRLMAFISFPTNFNNTNSLIYSICSQEGNIFQYNVDKSFPNKFDFLYSRSPEDHCYDKTYFYLYDVFNALKYSIDLELIRLSTNTSNTWNTEFLFSEQLSCPSYRQDDLLSTFMFLVPIIINLSYIATFLVLLGGIISEKESKMKEYLKLVGIKWHAFPLSVFIHSFGLYTILSILITVCSRVKLPSANVNASYYTEKALFEHTDSMIVFSTLFLYSVQLSLFTILLAQFFSKPFIAKVVGLLIWLVTSIDFFKSTPSTLKYFLCFFPNLALTFSIEVMSQYERSSLDFAFKNLYKNVYDDELNVGYILTAMIIFSTLYVPLIWYTEKVLPGDFGIPLPFYFLLQPSYWKRKLSKRKKYDFSLDDTDQNVKIQLKKITKFMYDGMRRKRVLDNLTLDFKQNEITCLLGVNGAGKSTLMNILCGMYPCSLGTISMFGYDLQTQLDRIRTKIGFCPQHDIHYGDLTVYEHFKLIAQIKGFSGGQLAVEIDRISKYVKLSDDLSTRSKNLSGGMKRRLSIGLALIGDTKIILLDEATSGMDPFNRRILWDLIKNYKQNRTIIYTTHFMDEADTLADRIAIINKGQLKCIGNPLELKALHGRGYKLTITKIESFNETGLFKFLAENSIENYKIELNTSSEICLSLLKGDNTQLLELLKNMESSKDNLGISSYAISHATVEEIFFKFASTQSRITKLEDFNESSLKAFNEEIKFKNGVRLVWQKFSTLIKKRFVIFYRRFILAILLLTLPLLVQALIVFFIPSQTYLMNSVGGSGSTRSLGKYDLNLSKYNPQKLVYGFYDSSNYSLFEEFFKKYLKRKEIETMRMEVNNAEDLDLYVLERRKENLKNLYGNYYAGVYFNVTNNEINQISVFYSTLAYHSSASIINEMTNLLLAYNLNSTEGVSIRTINSPIPSNGSIYLGNRFLGYLACFDVLPMSILNVLTSLVIAYVISVLVMFTTKEKSSGFKTLQLLTGTHSILYWLSNYVFDLILSMINASFLVIAIKLVDMSKNDPTSETSAIANNDNIPFVALILFTSCLSWPLIAHIWSFTIKSDTKSFVVLFIVLGVCSFGDVLLEFLLIIINAYKNDKSAKLPANDVIYALRILLACLCPNINVKRGLYNLKARKNEYCTNTINDLLETSTNANEAILSIKEPGIGLTILISFLQFIIGWILLIIIETKAIQTLRRLYKRSKIKDLFEKTALENDVLLEYERIGLENLKNLSQKETLVVKDVCKSYTKNTNDFLAVDHLTFGIKKNQCFGLLGLNGAGKSTFLKILSGEIESTSGKAFINGFDLNKNKSKVRSNLGFCPQNEYLPDCMTVKECLMFFAQLKGMYANDARRVVDELIKLFCLDIYNAKLLQDLSGGNRRKVSAAIAFMGKPSLVILDEPTSNMDPISKRNLWKVINKARDLGITIVLTSHSMEECEALCTCLAVMVNGQFKCHGSLQHLKKKYGRGYTLVIKLKSNSCEKVHDYLRENISNINLKSRQDSIITYEIKDDTSVAKIFEIIEMNREMLDIETYTLAQTTLEDVFLSLTSEQQREDFEKREDKIKSIFKDFDLKAFNFNLLRKVSKINSS